MSEEGSTNPLVPESADNAAFSNFANINQGFEGSGIFADAKSTIIDAAHGDWGALAADGVGDALDALGFVEDPFGSLLGAGIGWLIEHVSFLKKPLDLLAGDPEAVTRKAQTWTNIAEQLTKSAGDYQKSATALMAEHKGPAAEAYQRAAGDFAATIGQASTHAQSAAQAINVAGTVVGTTRGVIRDSVAQFAGDAVVKFIAASALAPVTFGATEAAFIADEVAEGASLATRIGGKMAKLAQTLDKLAQDGAKSAKALEETGSKLARATGKEAGEAKGAAKELEEFHSSAGTLNKDIEHHNAQVADKQDQIARREERIANAPDDAEAARQQHYLDDHILPGAEKVDARGQALDHQRGEVAEQRVDAWKHGTQESSFGRVPGLGHDGGLGRAHQWLEDHPVTDKVVDGAKEGVVQYGSTQPTREGDNQSEHSEEFEEWEKSHPDYDGSLQSEGGGSFTPHIEPRTAGDGSPG